MHLVLCSDEDLKFSFPNWSWMWVCGRVWLPSASARQTVPERSSAVAAPHLMTPALGAQSSWGCHSGLFL